MGWLSNPRAVEAIKRLRSVVENWDAQCTRCGAG